jgi:crotonobetainyl-CoA:carnitine CoA-transferase CaiB-like acyl-CoA transferase
MSLFDGMADWMSVPILHYECAGRVTARTGLSHAAIYPYDVFPAADGDVVLVVQSPPEWLRFCDTLGLSALADDPHFATNPKRLENREALRQRVAAVTRSLSVADLTARLDAGKLAWARVSTVEDMIRHPALRRITVSVPGGTFELPAPPLHPDLDTRSVPVAGEHGDAIRREFGGMP